MKRHPKNPIITRSDLVSNHPALQDVSSIFNPGAVMFRDQFLLLLRVQNRARETYLVKALSPDGVKFHISAEPVQITGLETCPHQIYHIYDPRITVSSEGSYYHILCAMDTSAGCFLGYFRTEDFDTLSFLSLASKPDVRNGIIFHGIKTRFERPNNYSGADGVKTGSSIICSRTEDYLNWEEIASVFSGRPHYWDELIGSGPPPIRTRVGWLHIYHGVATHFGSSNIYQAGVSLHDLQEPWITLARGRYNILEPREIYELTGQVPNVVFPSAAIPLITDLDGFTPLDCQIYVYYGAADTSVCLAITTARELLSHVQAE